MKIVTFLLVTISVLLIDPPVHGNVPICGKSQHKTVELILNGGVSPQGKWPWHIALLHRNQADLSYKCGGTLISRVHVLTAAHCVYKRGTDFVLNTGNLIVDAGTNDLNELRHRQRHSVKRVHTFVNYTRESHQYDIAILELDSQVEFNRYVQPACVLLQQNLTDMSGTVIGWGRTESEMTSTVLREAKLPVVDFITCLNNDRAAFGHTLQKEMFCAGFTNGTGACNGDSGGGIFFEVNGAWHLGGVISFTKNRDEDITLCQAKGYTAFTKVYDFLPWIRNKTDLQHLIGDAEENASMFCRAKPASATTNGARKLPRHCGVYYPSRLKFGQQTKVFEFPWMAQITNEERVWLAVGTLIHERYVLTEAGLTTQSRKANLKIVRFGEHNVNKVIDCNENEDCALPVLDIYIECFIRHQNYRGIVKGHNIALIKLVKNVEFQDHIQPICLPTSAKLREMELPRYIITGWGETQEGEPSAVLLKATISPIDLAECQKMANNVTRRLQLTNDQMCADESGNAVSVGRGDAGAPIGYAVRHNGIRFVQFGIASHDLVDPDKNRRVYTKIGPYMEWILANIGP